MLFPILSQLPPPPVVIASVGPGWYRDQQVENVPYDLFIPAGELRGCVLVLPGWNFPRTSWVENSDLEKYAQDYGYALILPEMGKTVYESAYYPETTLKWHPTIPGGKFIKDYFIPAIQTRHQLLLPGKDNFLLGLSTGGRGVALIALANPGLFVAGASLSGDFSQENMPQDNLMTAVYGNFEQFSQRWQTVDNPQAQVAEWQMPLYLTHGTADDVVPEAQSRLFFEKLQSQPAPPIIVYEPVEGAGHDYTFWNSQLSNIFGFFEKYR